MRDFDPGNELRYLSIADEALSNGSVWCFSNHGVMYSDKPPLYLWIVMAGKLIFGHHHMWFLALFSYIPMLLTGLVMDQWARPYMSMRQRQTSLLMLFTCGLFPAQGIFLRMDMLMTLWIVLALRQSWRLIDKPSAAGSALLGLYTFLALFTKGPLGVLFPLGGSLVFMLATGRGRRFFRVWTWSAWLVLSGCAAIWFGCVYVEGGAEYLNNLVFHQTVDRAVDAFHHKRPFWFYFAVIWYVAAPWSVVTAALAIVKRKECLHGDFRRMMVSVFLFIFISLSCISSKLQVYLLPAIPFMVYLGGSLLSDAKVEKWIMGAASALLVVVFAASFAVPWINPEFGYGDVCRKARELDPSAVYVSKDVYRGENMDVYFDVPVKVVASDSVPADPGAIYIYREGKKKLPLSIKKL